MDPNQVTYKWVVATLLLILTGFAGLYVHSTDARLTGLEVKQDIDTGAIPAIREEIRAMRESLARIEDKLERRR